MLRDELLRVFHFVIICLKPHAFLIFSHFWAVSAFCRFWAFASLFGKTFPGGVGLAREERNVVVVFFWKARAWLKRSLLGWEGDGRFVWGFHRQKPFWRSIRKYQVVND